MPKRSCDNCGYVGITVRWYLYQKDAEVLLCKGCASSFTAHLEVIDTSK